MYSQEKADAICRHLGSGLSLRKACEAEGGPDPSTVLRWVDANEAFAQQYADARARGYQLLADEIIDISDEAEFEPVPGVRDEDEAREVRVDATAVARNRLRVDARKWMLAKMLPKVYGDKVTQEHTGSIEHAHTVGISAATAELLDTLRAGSGDSGHASSVPD